METKEMLLAEADANVHSARKAIEQEVHTTTKTIERYQQPGQSDPFVKAKLLAHFHERLDQLHHLFPSPFFFRGDIVSDEGKAQTIHFAKFPLIEKGIFSWTSPAARLRFADIGPVSYALPDNPAWSGTLLRKDQLMIAGGEIRFMTSETASEGRTLVYQEQLSRRKTDFMLPEIVARMERAQDDVIRAHWKGSFLISGPAGSGKTTLAFHRIAFLLQSPETAQYFSDENIIVFVQDEGTRKYFSRLLPELGIHSVTVTTFAAWAFEQLGIHQETFVRRQNGTDARIDAYEYHKIQSLQDAILSPSAKDPFTFLENSYKNHFTPDDLILFTEQRSAHTLDRFDVSLLLKHFVQQKGPLQKEEIYFQQKKGFEVARKKRHVPLTYSFIVVDEVQNYLPKQISLLRSCIDPETQAILYVGDLRQQVLLGTLKKWEDVGELFEQGRKIELDKVYRSTKQILHYTQSLGYATHIPDELREGTSVTEEIHKDAVSEIQRIKQLAQVQDKKMQTGVIGFLETYLELFKQELGSIPNLHVLTVSQAQGVEFDRVFIVGIHHDLFTSSAKDNRTDAAYQKDLAAIRRDLLYVALTRAMDELFVFGKQTLSKLSIR